MQKGLNDAIAYFATASTVAEGGVSNDAPPVAVEAIKSMQAALSTLLAAQGNKIESGVKTVHGAETLVKELRQENRKLKAEIRDADKRFKELEKRFDSVHKQVEKVERNYAKALKATERKLAEKFVVSPLNREKKETAKEKKAREEREAIEKHELQLAKRRIRDRRRREEVKQEEAKRQKLRDTAAVKRSSLRREQKQKRLKGDLEAIERHELQLEKRRKRQNKNGKKKTTKTKAKMSLTRELFGDYNDFENGDRVKIRWNGDKRWYPGTVLAVNKDGTYRVLYDDGDMGHNEKREEMRAADEDETDDEEMDDDDDDDDDDDEADEADEADDDDDDDDDGNDDDDFDGDEDPEYEAKNILREEKRKGGLIYYLIEWKTSILSQTKVAEMKIPLENVSKETNRRARKVRYRVRWSNTWEPAENANDLLIG